ASATASRRAPARPRTAPRATWASGWPTERGSRPRRGLGRGPERADAAGRPRPTVPRTGSALAQPVGVLRGLVGEPPGHARRRVLVDEPPGDLFGQPAADRAAPDVVARGDAGEGARVVDEAGEVVDPGGLDDGVEVALEA